MRFTKMQGIGNDYVYVNGFQERVDDPAALSIRVSDRHFGVGSDGLILVLPSERADFRMRMFNADGSEAEMCGNGARCVGRYVYEHGLTRRREFTLETGGGVRFTRGDGWAWVCPDDAKAEFRIVTEAASAEAAAELCDFCRERLESLNREK